MCELLYLLSFYICSNGSNRRPEIRAARRCQCDTCVDDWMYYGHEYLTGNIQAQRHLTNKVFSKRP